MCGGERGGGRGRQGCQSVGDQSGEKLKRFCVSAHRLSLGVVHI